MTPTWCLRCGFCCEDENCISFKRVGIYGLGCCMIYNNRPERCKLKISSKLNECPIGKRFWESIGIYDEIIEEIKRFEKTA